MSWHRTTWWSMFRKRRGSRSYTGEDGGGWCDHTELLRSCTRIAWGDQKNSLTIVSQRNCEDSQERHPGRLRRSPPLMSTEAAPLWMCAWHPSNAAQHARMLRRRLSTGKRRSTKEKSKTRSSSFCTHR